MVRSVGCDISKGDVFPYITKNSFVCENNQGILLFIREEQVCIEIMVLNKCNK